MNGRFKKLLVHQLQVGMYVSDLDRPWLESPFLVEGLLIRSPEEIEILNEICDFVFIDIGKSPVCTSKRVSIGKSIKEIFPEKKLKPFENKTSLAQELQSVKSIYQDYETAVSKIYDDAKSGQKLSIRSANEAVGNIVGSLVRNPDACTLLYRMKKKGDYIYNHAIGTSIWSATIGRQIGLPPLELKKLALSGLLCDIGKVKISSRILNKPNKLSSEECQAIKSHIEIDDDFRNNFPGLAESIVETINTHHERHDGSGYPLGIRGDEIPVLSRIVGLADCYDAMISDKPYAKAMSTYDAAKELYELRDIYFQSEIIDEFIQAVGLYPIGSLLELNNGEVGIVVEVYPQHRLKPKLLMLLNSMKEPIEGDSYLNLLDKTTTKTDDPFNIKGCLEPGTYNLDANDYFI